MTTHEMQMTPEFTAHLERLAAEAEANATPLPFSILQDSGGRYATVCPYCKHQDMIVEVDRAIRWNALKLTGLDTAWATVGEADFEFAEFRCTHCNTEVSVADGFEITSWD